MAVGKRGDVAVSGESRGQGTVKYLHDLDLLSSRESLELVVLGDVSVESDVLEMLADKLSAHLARSGSLTTGLEIVELLNELDESVLDELLAGHEGVVLMRGTRKRRQREPGRSERDDGSVPCECASAT